MKFIEAFEVLRSYRREYERLDCEVRKIRAKPESMRSGSESAPKDAITYKRNLVECEYNEMASDNKIAKSLEELNAGDYLSVAFIVTVVTVFAIGIAI